MGNAPYDLHNISGYYIARPGKRQEKIAAQPLFSSGDGFRPKISCSKSVLISDRSWFWYDSAQWM
jgi:hypothetical protein